MPYDQVMAKWKRHTLRSGNGAPIIDRKQAIAVMLSEKRKAEEGKEEYQPKTPAGHPLHRLKRKFTGGN
jgi:hypothetical protein